MVLRYVILVPTTYGPDGEKSLVLVKIFLIASDRKPNKVARVKKSIYFPVKDRAW